MKTNCTTDLQAMSMQEMRDVNGGCCLIKFLIKLFCCKPKKPGCGGGKDPNQPEGY